MSYGKPVIIEQTDKFAVCSYGNGAAYELTVKDRSGYRSVFLQGDDALAWREDYEAMQNAHTTEDSAWYHRTWNDCLAELIMDYMPEETV